MGSLAKVISEIGLNHLIKLVDIIESFLFFYCVIGVKSIIKACSSTKLNKKITINKSLIGEV